MTIGRLRLGGAACLAALAVIGGCAAPEATGGVDRPAAGRVAKVAARVDAPVRVRRVAAAPSVAPVPAAAPALPPPAVPVVVATATPPNAGEVARQLFAPDLVTGSVDRPVLPASADDHAARLRRELVSLYWRSIAGERLLPLLAAADARARKNIADARALQAEMQTSPELAMTLERTMVELRREIVRIEGDLILARTQFSALAGFPADRAKPPRTADPNEVPSGAAGSVARVRLDQSMREVRIAEDALAVQKRLSEIARVTFEAGKIGEQALARDELLALIAEGKLELARADERGARAALTVDTAPPVTAVAR